MNMTSFLNTIALTLMISVATVELKPLTSIGLARRGQVDSHGALGAFYVVHRPDDNVERSMFWAHLSALDPKSSSNDQNVVQNDVQLSANVPTKSAVPGVYWDKCKMVRSEDER